MYGVYAGVTERLEEMRERERWEERKLINEANLEVKTLGKREHCV